MGIDIGWKMVRGASYDAWRDFVDTALLEEGECQDLGEFLVEECDLYRVSPRYDAGSEECIFGIKLAGADYATSIDLVELKSKEIAADKKFQEIFKGKLLGLQLETICSQNVW